MSDIENSSENVEGNKIISDNINSCNKYQSNYVSKEFLNKKILFNDTISAKNSRIGILRTDTQNKNVVKQFENASMNIPNEELAKLKISDNDYIHTFNNKNSQPSYEQENVAFIDKNQNEVDNYDEKENFIDKTDDTGYINSNNFSKFTGKDLPINQNNRECIKNNLNNLPTFQNYSNQFTNSRIKNYPKKLNELYNINTETNNYLNLANLPDKKKDLITNKNFNFQYVAGIEKIESKPDSELKRSENLINEINDLYFRKENKYNEDNLYSLNERHFQTDKFPIYFSFNNLENIKHQKMITHSNYGVINKEEVLDSKNQERNYIELNRYHLSNLQGDDNIFKSKKNSNEILFNVFSNKYNTGSLREVDKFIEPKLIPGENQINNISLDLIKPLPNINLDDFYHEEIDTVNDKILDKNQGNYIENSNIIQYNKESKIPESVVNYSSLENIEPDNLRTNNHCFNFHNVIINSKDKIQDDLLKNFSKEDKLPENYNIISSHLNEKKENIEINENEYNDHFINYKKNLDIKQLIHINNNFYNLFEKTITIFNLTLQNNLGFFFSQFVDNLKLKEKMINEFLELDIKIPKILRNCLIKSSNFFGRANNFIKQRKKMRHIIIKYQNLRERFQSKTRKRIMQAFKDFKIQFNVWLSHTRKELQKNILWYE